MDTDFDTRSLLLALDLAGTAVFAVSGAAVGVKHRLDVFGVCVLALVAGSAGGMLARASSRDISCSCRLR